MATTLSDLFPVSLLRDMIADGFVRQFEHDSGDILGYTYSERAQWDRVWNTCTRQCRGLIADTNGRVLARPFSKFFNLGDDPEADAQYSGKPFELQEKLDGSLGILYAWDGDHHVATKGAFHSDQAQWATDEIRRIGAPPNANEVTHLFEIIYPDNQIVVDYGDRSELVLLEAIRISDGSRASSTWPSTKAQFAVPDDGTIASVRKTYSGLDTGNFEGFVAVYEDGHRVKIKLSSYVRIHRILTSTSNKSVWEMLAAGEDPTVTADAIPDEFHAWVRQQIADLRGAFDSIEREYRAQFNQISNLLSNRRDFAHVATKADHPSILFSMADGKDYTPTIWKLLRPEEIEYPPSHI